MSDSEETNIAERVKFWEEQDRINKVIIPRILKNHDLLTEISKQVTIFSNTIAELESKIVINEKQLEKLKMNSQLPLLKDTRSFVLSISAFLIAVISLIINLAR